MGDRNNPIKFGPEWLRNMSRERSAARSNSQGTSGSGGPSSGAGASGGPSGSAGASGVASASSAASQSTTNTTSKIRLANLRYGREEMLALYDRNAEAPSELKFNDTLYQPRGKQPVALNNNFEDDIRDNLRSAPPIGGMASGDRFGIGRGGARGIIIGGSGRSRGSYRQLTSGRGPTPWHMGNPRMPGYSGGPEDEGPSTSRPWNNNTLNTNPNRNSGDQTDWASKMFRSKRQGNNTNWRQPQSRDDGEEWRSSETASRNRQLEKWDFRDWGERQSGDKPQSWNNNRRPWVAGDSQTEENLPEWAAESAECGGTFDSSGAFHGYSNDDTNLPKHQDSAYQLARSHTHGSFPRPKAVEEGSEEWWASEKAKKLSPKRFDASEIKFKKPGIADAAPTNSSNKTNSAEEAAPSATPDKVEPQPETPEPPETRASAQNEDKYNDTNSYIVISKYGKNKTFDALMRSDINMEEASDERGNFQSVIIAANNSLRQKHQHLVSAVNENPKALQNLKLSTNKPDMEHRPLKTPEDLLVDNIFGMTMDDKEIISPSPANAMMNRNSSGLSSQKHNPNMQMNMSSSGVPNHVIPREMMSSQNLQNVSMQQVHTSSGMQPEGASGMQATLMQSAGHSSGIPTSGIPAGGMQSSGMPPVGLPSPRMPTVGLPNSGMLQSQRVQTPGMQPVMQQVGITNSALNASLGLPIGPNPNIGLPMQALPPQVMPNVCMANNIGSIGASGMAMQPPVNLPAFQSGTGIPGMSNNVGNNSLYLGQNPNNPTMVSSNDMPMTNHTGQNNIFPMQGLQQPGAQASYGNSIYSNNSANLADQWYYEDPERNIQGPFSSKDMYNWYRAGFFSPSLMVRRACENIMRPLGTYGPVVPFAHVDVLQSFPMSGASESRPQGHDNFLSSLSSLSLDVININNMNLSDNPPMDTIQFGSVGLMPNQTFAQPPPMVDSLWGQSSSSNDLMWMQQPVAENRAGVNNLSMFFWEQPPSAIAPNSLLPEDITKEMKTEDQILAQLRASQNIGPPPMPFMNEQKVATPTVPAKPDECFPTVNATPNLEELHKLIQKDTLTGNAAEADIPEAQPKADKITKLDHSSSDTSITKGQSQNKVAVDSKPSKPSKDSEKAAKNKENNTTKKSKKTKEDKKDDIVELKTREDEVIKAEKRSQEPSPSKNKKEEKSNNKKELEREKKEWIKEGFTIVKGAEKNVTKDSKKKAEEARASEEAERRRKEEEKIAAEEDKKRKQSESTKKQQEQQQQQHRQASESVVKKAPWSAVANQNLQAINRDGLTLAEIQRLEREKKLEQMKEQQQMMQIIAQQQAAALAREQEMQAGLGWAKKKGTNSTPGQSLAEIQAEARKQAAAAAAATAAQVPEETPAVTAAPANHVPWGNTHNGGMGFWDTQLNQPAKQEKSQEPAKAEAKKNNKKPTVVIAPKKETSPVVEFEGWCTDTLSSWSSKIDVPTFVGFLKDIESPYEVKDYVKCYLGESKDSSDFARQFLERRSKLLRVGMVTPSDDLCSPAIAVNPRTNSGSDYQEVKGKGKKTKKNKMLKVDARILGFSVTASQDRINVGDIDTV